MEYIAFGKRISRVREARNMTLEAISAECGMPMAALAALEAGKAEASLDALVDIANALDASIDYLLADSLTRPHISRAEKNALLRERLEYMLN